MELRGSAPSTFESPMRSVPGEYIVGFKPGVGVAEQRATVRSLAPLGIEELPSINGLLVKTDPNVNPGVVGIDTGPDSPVAFSQPNYLHTLRDDQLAASPVAVRDAVHGATVDPLLSQQYHLANTGQTGGTPGADINATEAWKTSTGKGVVIAVADTNIDITHPDIAPNVWTNPGEIDGNGIDDDHNGYVDDIHGWNFGRNNNRPQDGGQTHGTHVAGIIAAAQGNGEGGSGVAPDATIMPIPVLTGGATTANAVKAFDYAVKNGANIISNSWGGNIYEPALDAAVRQTTKAGTLVVVASGNENWDTGIHGSYPDNYPGSLSVAASDNRDNKASYSNRGSLTIDVAAPGDKILSSLPGGKYGSMSGTSMAAPVVSAVAAQVKSKYPNLTMQQVADRIMKSAKHDGTAAGWNSLVTSGGRIDAAAALMPIATPTAPVPAAPAKAGSAVTLGFGTDVAEGQKFAVEVSTNPTATSSVADSFENGTSRVFRTTGDQSWSVGDQVAKDGTKSFQVSGLKREEQSRLQLTETLPTESEVSFWYRGGQGAELSFFVDNDLQFQPTQDETWRQYSVTLPAGEHTFSWLAGSRASQRTPVAIDGLKIGQVSDAKWSPVGEIEPGAATELQWNAPADAAGQTAQARVRADNGRWAGDWVTGPAFEVR